jgi:CHAD domain-containing protein
MRQLETSSSSTIRNGHPVAVAGDPAHDLAPKTLNCLIFSLKKQWKCYRKQLRKCQRKFSERSVHDLRVSARRLLSLLDLLAHFLSPSRLEKTQNALKRHLDTFDDLRDAQVQLAAVSKLGQEFPAARCFHRFLKKRGARLIRSTYKKARRLRSKPLGKHIEAAREDLKAWVKAARPKQPTPLLISAVNRAFSVTRKLKEHITPNDTHSIHCTRVAFKKFRYVVEALADHLPWANERLLQRMRRYQTLMGDIQDAEVLLRALQKFLGKEKTKIQQSARFERELQRRRQGLIKKYLGAADQLLDFWPPAGTPCRGRPHPTLGNGGHAKSSNRNGSHSPRLPSKNKSL